MKAGMNGVINLSVQDGWWGEGYRPGNGWAIKPATGAGDPERRDREEARTLYEILQDHVLPAYYDRVPAGYPPAWLRMAKQSMASILPRFNAGRMLNEYVTKLYMPAATHGRAFVANDGAIATSVAQFKRRVRDAWPGVSLRVVSDGARWITFGDSVDVDVDVDLAGLAPDDVVVELVLERADETDEAGVLRSYRLQPTGDADATGHHRYRLAHAPEVCGHLGYRVRIFPFHPELAHPHETGLMRWAGPSRRPYPPGSRRRP
jgi:starch phosphorylase